MNEVNRILKLLEVSFDSEGWLFPGMNDSLIGVTCEAATLRPIVAAHNIIEIVQHVARWEDTAFKWLTGEKPELIYRPPEVWDWSEINEGSEEQWSAAVKEIRANHDRLVAAVAQLDDRDLSRRVPKGDYTVTELLHAIIQHNLYHAGQIALLKKAAR
ncbi:MAG: DinB family protein [candidate division Zixibacteria bacterium]|nr:DinB family protein [candidate division Zixibacteria bacterium]